MNGPTSDAGSSRGPNRSLPPVPPPRPAEALNARFNAYDNRSHLGLGPSSSSSLPSPSAHPSTLKFERQLPPIPPLADSSSNARSASASSRPTWSASNPYDLQRMYDHPPRPTPPLPPPPPTPPNPPPDSPFDPFSAQEAYDHQRRLALGEHLPVRPDLVSPSAEVRRSSWELEEADRLEAIRLSLEDAALNDQVSGGFGTADVGGGWEGGMERRSSAARSSDGWTHTPPLADSKPSQHPQSSSFESEFALHASLLTSLKAWQAGSLPASLEWHELVPKSVRLGLDGKAGERQGLIWEVLRSEMEFVRNLEGGLNGYFTPIAAATSNVLSPETKESFMQDTFFNIDSIFPKHSKMVFRLQERQLETHPVVDSIADILIDSLIELLGPYELYLKHYPYAEARLRKEMSSNPAFGAFVSKLSESPLVRKQDLASFLHSPLSRLSKLALALQRLLKITPKEHDDHLQLPVILDQIGGMLRSVQPGVDAAEKRVKAWRIARALRFKKGERNDLGLELESDQRALLGMGKVWRRQRNERDWHGWTQLCMILFDNYLLITKEETVPGGTPGLEEDLMYSVVSRPIPLDFLSLVGSTSDPPEHRRDMIVDYQRRKPFKVSNLLEPITQPERDVYGFHFEHRGLRKGYSVYLESEGERKDWVEKIWEQVGVRKVVLESNPLISFQTLIYSPPCRTSRTPSFNRPSPIPRMSEVSPPPPASPLISSPVSTRSVSTYTGSHRASNSFDGSFSNGRVEERGFGTTAGGGGGGVRIESATSFDRFDKEMLMVADSDGLSVGYRDDSRSHRHVIESSSITEIYLLEEIGRLLVLATNTLYSTSLDDLLPSPDPDQWPKIRKESGETINAWGESVDGFRVGRRDGKLLIVYWCFNRLVGQSSLEVYEPLITSSDQQSLSISSLLHKRSDSTASKKKPPPGYRHLASGCVMGAVYSISFFGSSIYVATDKGFIVMDPLRPSTSSPNTPSFPESSASKAIFTTLKSRVSSYQPLLMHKIANDSFLCVYETGCCWVDKQGVVAKDGAHLTWETRASTAVIRDRNLILFSKDKRFLAVHDLWFGTLKQVAEGRFRLVGDGEGKRVLAVRGEQMVEFTETVALPLHSN